MAGEARPPRSVRAAAWAIPWWGGYLPAKLSQIFVSDNHLDGTTSDSRALCRTPADTVLDQGHGNRLIGCQAVTP